MNVHERTLELAAAAFDFGLSPADRQALDGHLATCMQCRGDVDGLADDVRRLASRPPHALSVYRAEAIRATLEQPRRGMSPALVLVTAALLLLLAVAGATVGAQVIRRLAEPRLGVLPAPAVLLTPTPHASPSPAEAGAPAWQLASLGELPGLDFGPTAVSSSDLGWVAVGAPACTKTGEWTFDCMLQVAVSADGRQWERVAGNTPLILGYGPPSSGPEAGMVDVAAGPDGYVAVGFGSGDVGPGNAGRGVAGTAWWSRDGRTWEAQRLDVGARPSAVLRAPDRWLIGGVIYRDDGPIAAIWTSTDGRAWTRIEDGAAFDIGGYVDTMEDPASGGIRSFSSNGDLLVAVGQACADAGRPCTGAAWTSGDGLAWERLDALPPVDWIADVVSVNGGFTAVAERCVDSACKAVVLVSGDGRTWAEVPPALPEQAAIAAGDGVIAMVTGEYRNLDVRASSDGTTWAPLGSLAVPDGVNWGAPVLAADSDGGIEIMIKSDPVDELATDADATVAGWSVTPVR